MTLALGDRFKKFDLQKLRTYERYEDKEAEVGAGKPLSIKKHLNNSALEKMKLELNEKVENIPVWFEYSKDKQRELIENFFDTKLKVEFHLENISEKEKKDIIDNLTNQVCGFGILQNYLDQKNVNSVIVNGTNSVLIDISGKILDTETSLNKNQLNFLIQNIKQNAETKINQDDIVLYTNLNGYFISIISPSASVRGVTVSIRKKPKITGLNSLLLSKFLNKDVADFLISVLKSNKKVIISGDMATGKTTLTDNLLTSVMHNERVTILEDIPELVSEFPKFMKFSLDNLKSARDFERIFSANLYMSPEFWVFDSKNLKYISTFTVNIQEKSGCIMAVSASDVENALNKLISSLVINSGYSEKLAKQKILTTFDYIIQLGKDKKGKPYLKSVSELNFTRNSAQNFRELYNIESIMNN